MSELGQWLKNARQAKDLSLEQVEEKTRIRVKFLAALEEGNHTELPDEISARGFVRNYAIFLGLDPDKALEKYQTTEKSSLNAEPRLFRPLEVTLVRTAAGRFRGWLVLLSLILALITAGIWAWSTGRLPFAWPPSLPSFRPNPTSTQLPTNTPAPSAIESPTRPLQPTQTVKVVAEATTIPTPTPMPSPTPKPTSTNSVLTRPTPTPSPSPTATATTPAATLTAETESESPSPFGSPIPTEEINVIVEIVVDQESWIEITIDGHNVLRELLQPGDRGSWAARREIIMWVGNGGGVEATVNGEFLGRLGEPAQVVQFAWGAAGEITPEPTFTATPTSEPTTEPQETPTP